MLERETINIVRFGIPGLFAPDPVVVSLRSWESDERVCGVSRYRATVLVNNDHLGVVNLEEWPGRQAVVCLSMNSILGASYRCMSGYIEGMEILHQSHGRSQVELELLGHPPPKFLQASALYKDLSEYEVGRRIFEQSGGTVRGYFPAQGAGSLQEVDVARACLMQYKESDFDFLERIFWNKGLMYQIGLNEEDSRQRDFPEQPFKYELGLWTDFSQCPESSNVEVLSVSEQSVSSTIGERTGIYNVRLKRNAVSPRGEGLGISDEDMHQAQRHRLLESESKSGTEHRWNHYGSFVENREPAGEMSGPLSLWQQSVNQVRWCWESDSPLLRLGRVSVSGLPDGTYLGSAEDEMCVVRLRQEFRRTGNGIWKVTGSAEAVPGRGKWYPKAPASALIPTVLQGMVVKDEGADTLQPGERPEEDNQFDIDRFGRVAVRLMGFDARTPDAGLSSDGESMESGAVRLRVASPMAGTGHGMYTGLPAGSEVAVAFVDGESQLPWVVGSAFGQKDDAVNPAILDPEKPGDWVFSVSDTATIQALQALVLDADRIGLNPAEVNEDGVSEDGQPVASIRLDRTEGTVKIDASSEVGTEAPDGGIVETTAEFVDAIGFLCANTGQGTENTIVTAFASVFWTSLVAGAVFGHLVEHSLVGYESADTRWKNREVIDEKKRLMEKCHMSETRAIDVAFQLCDSGFHLFP